MNKDNHLMMEAMQSKFTGRGPVNDIVVSELHKMHNNLNDMATMIHLNPNDQVDQLLSKIRDLADMLIADKRSEQEETAEQRIAAAKAKAQQIKSHVKDAKLAGEMDAYGRGLKQIYGKNESAENEPHGYPQGMTAIQNLVLNELKKRGFQLTKIGHADKESDAYPTVYMHKRSGPMHAVAEIDGMGSINGEHYKEYLANLKDASEDAEHRSNAQHAAIAIALQKAGKKPS